MSSSLTHAKQNRAPAPEATCVEGLRKEDDGLDRLESILRTATTKSSEAIGAIIYYLARHPEWTAKTKNDLWNTLISTFNRRPNGNSAVIFMNLITPELDYVYWGGNRGNLFIIRSDGAIFHSKNPLRPDPMKNLPGGYHIDWSDRTIHEVLATKNAAQP